MDGCSFDYGREKVVDTFSLSIDKGEAVAIAGPNGAGKTTLLKLVTGLLRPTSGLVEVEGRPPADMVNRELARGLAVVPQDAAFYFPYRIRDVVRMGRTPYLGFWGFEAGEDLEAADAALAFCDLGHLADRLVTQVSGGERQRAIIARALAQQPRILVLDEPMRSLDPRHTQDVLGILARLRAEGGLTILVVSHDLNAMASFADRLVLMKNGREMCEGTPEEVLVPDALRETFDLDVEVLRSGSGRPVVVPRG
jgi:iron complex transport system ATP-binding protein